MIGWPSIVHVLTRPTVQKPRESVPHVLLFLVFILFYFILFLVRIVITSNWPTDVVMYCPSMHSV